MVIAEITYENGARCGLRSRSVRGMWNRIYRITATYGLVRIWLFKTEKREEMEFYGGC